MRFLTTLHGCPATTLRWQPGLLSEGNEKKEFVSCGMPSFSFGPDRFAPVRASTGCVYVGERVHSI